MKRLLFILFVLFSLSINAQKVTEGIFPSLKGQSKINFIIDYSDMTIDKKSVSDWIEYRNAQQPKYDASKELDEELKPVVNEQLLKYINEKLEKHNAFLTKSQDCKYTVVAMPQNVSKKGDNITKFLLKESNSDKTVVSVEVKGSGGTFGSMCNLWSDGFKDTAKKIGSFFSKMFK